jgi:hypothetical protein
MSAGLYTAVIIGFVGLVILVSIIKFIMAFYKNPQRAVQLIRLDTRTYLFFILFLSMNFVFLVGYLLQIVNSVKDSDLIAILIYALGTSIFFIALTFIISKKYKL